MNWDKKTEPALQMGSDKMKPRQSDFLTDVIGIGNFHPKIKGD
jgi:hypothetical protein